MVALWYSGWKQGQLETDLLENMWLTTAPAKVKILFYTSIAERWQIAAKRICINIYIYNIVDCIAYLMTKRTLLAFDFGTKSIGVAIGQEVTATARALTAFKAQDGMPDWSQVERIINEWQPDLLVVGLPLNMDGTEQELTVKARKFANRLRDRFGKPVELQDERLSTVEGRADLFERGGFRALNKCQVDATSAVIILESWLSR